MIVEAFETDDFHALSIVDYMYLICISGLPGEMAICSPERALALL